jgi:hypothetical protein
MIKQLLVIFRVLSLLFLASDYLRKECLIYKDGFGVKQKTNTLLAFRRFEQWLEV